MAYTPENRTAMLNIFNAIKAKMDTITNPTVRTNLQGLFASQDVANASDEQLANWLKDSDVIAGINAIESNAELVKGLYVRAGIDTSSLALPSSGTGTPGETDILKMLTENVGLPMPLASAIAGYFFGGGAGGAAKWGAGGAGVSLLMNWLNSDDGKKLVAQVTGSMGEGGKGLAGLLSGGAEGVGGLLGGLGGIAGTLGDTFGDLANNPKLKGMLDTVLGFVKDQPLVAAAVGYGLYAMFGNGFSLGGIFSGMSTAMLAMAAAWIAESVLDIGGPSRMSSIAMDTPGSNVTFDATTGERVSASPTELRTAKGRVIEPDLQIGN